MSGWEHADTGFETPATLDDRQLKALKNTWRLLFEWFALNDKDLTGAWAKAFPDAEVDTELQAVLKETSPALLRKDFYTLLRHDYPDLVPLRFLKARLYELDKSTRMLLCSLSFRRKAIPVAMRSETRHDMDFLRSMKKAKSFVPCYDKRGRTITTIRIRNHSRGDCTQETFENYMLYCMEHAHLLHLPYQDRTVLLVDMTGFSLTALDLTAIKFIIQNFEQNYPEELSEGIIHNAPWLFTTAWAAIKPLLRGPTREKITFTSTENDLAAKLGKEAARTVLTYQLEYNGRPIDEEWKDEAANPATASQEFMAAQKVWEDNIKTFEGLTERWIDPELVKAVSSADEIAKLEADRIDASWTLAESYWLIDKFVRPSSYYDRLGLLPPREDGPMTVCKSVPGSAPLSRQNTGLSRQSTLASELGVSQPGTPRTDRPSLKEKLTNNDSSASLSKLRGKNA